MYTKSVLLQNPLVRHRLKGESALLETAHEANAHFVMTFVGLIPAPFIRCSGDLIMSLPPPLPRTAYRLSSNGRAPCAKWGDSWSTGWLRCVFAPLAVSDNARKSEQRQAQPQTRALAVAASPASCIQVWKGLSQAVGCSA